MVIALDEVADEPLLSRALILVFVALAITAGVYGVVALIVKMDDAGVHLARTGEGGAATLGRGLVRAMPIVLSVLSKVGIAAMLWVGGHILLVGLDELGLSWPYDTVHHLEEDVARRARRRRRLADQHGRLGGPRPRRRRDRGRRPAPQEGRPLTLGRYLPILPGDAAAQAWNPVAPRGRDPRRGPVAAPCRRGLVPRLRPRATLREQSGSSKALTGHGTLYKALGRLEEFGLLASRWEDAEAAEGRPRRRLYELTGQGVEAATRPAGRPVAATPSPRIASRPA